MKIRLVLLAAAVMASQGAFAFGAGGGQIKVSASQNLVKPSKADMTAKLNTKKVTIPAEAPANSSACEKELAALKREAATIFNNCITTPPAGSPAKLFDAMNITQAIQYCAPGAVDAACLTKVANDQDTFCKALAKPKNDAIPAKEAQCKAAKDAENAAAKKACDDAKAAFTTAQKSYTDQDTKVKNLQAGVNGLQSNISAKDKEIAELEAKLATAKAQKATLATSLATFTNSLKAGQSELASLLSVLNAKTTEKTNKCGK